MNTSVEYDKKQIPSNKNTFRYTYIWEWGKNGETLYWMEVRIKNYENEILWKWFRRENWGRIYVCTYCLYTDSISCLFHAHFLSSMCNKLWSSQRGLHCLSDWFTGCTISFPIFSNSNRILLYILRVQYKYVLLSTT